MTTREFTGQLDRMIRIEVPGAVTGTDEFGQPIYADPTFRTVWAARSDRTVNDQFTQDAHKSVGISYVSVYVIRHESLGDIRQGTIMWDENGDRTEIVGLSELGRRRFWELLIRRIG